MPPWNVLDEESLNLLRMNVETLTHSTTDSYIGGRFLPPHSPVFRVVTPPAYLCSSLHSWLRRSLWAGMLLPASERHLVMTVGRLFQPLPVLVAQRWLPGGRFQPQRSQQPIDGNCPHLLSLLTLYQQSARCCLSPLLPRWRLHLFACIYSLVDHDFLIHSPYLTISYPSTMSNNIPCQMKPLILIPSPYHYPSHCPCCIHFDI
jgi:hypothetical protein